MDATYFYFIKGLFFLILSDCDMYFFYYYRELKLYFLLQESYRYLKVYRKCRVLVKGNIPIATALSKPTDGGIPYKTSGIYVFKQRRTVIYLGMSSNDIRNRVQVINVGGGRESSKNGNACPKVDESFTHSLHIYNVCYMYTYT